MYVFESDQGGHFLTPLSQKSSQYIHDSIHVFDGQFTVDSDKIKLVDTVLGLYAHALLSHQEGKRDGEVMIIDEIKKNKATIFPTEFFEHLIPLLEESITSMDIRTMMTIRASQLPRELAHMEKAHVPVQTGSSLKDLFLEGKTADGPARRKASFSAVSPATLPEPVAPSLHEDSYLSA